MFSILPNLADFVIVISGARTSPRTMLGNQEPSLVDRSFASEHDMRGFEYQHNHFFSAVFCACVDHLKYVPGIGFVEVSCS